MAEKKSIRRLEIEPAENGGHTVIHHTKSSPDAYQEPVQHVFGANQGHEMLAHVANTLAIPEHEGKGLDADAVDRVRKKAGR